MFPKLFLTVLLSFSAGILAQEFECPDVDTPPCEELLYSNEYNCNQYWSCTQGCLHYLFDCPETLHFNPDLQVCVLPSNYSCSDEPLPSPSVFFVARDSNQLLRQDPVSFQEELVDRNLDFDMTNNHFTTPNIGIYFFTMNMGFIDGRRSNFILSSGVDYIEEVGIRRVSTQHNGPDTSNRDVIMGLSTADSLSMLSEGGLYSDDGYQTSFGGFSLHDTMNTADAFSVSRDSAFSTPGTISFNQIIVNEGLHFNLNSGTFTVPQDGLYFFSYSVGIVSDSENADVAVQLHVDGVSQSEIWRNHAVYNGFDTLSRTQMLYLTTNEEVTLELVRGEIDSDANQQICFNAFLYDPSSPDTANPLIPTAWSVHRTSDFTATATETLLFDDIDVNEGGAFDNVSSEVTITQSGYYYLQVNAGALPNTPVDMNIVVSGAIRANLLRESNVHTGVDTLGRSVILYLSVGNTVRVDVAANTGVYGSINRHTSFTGLLLVNR